MYALAHVQTQADGRKGRTLRKTGRTYRTGERSMGGQVRRGPRQVPHKQARIGRVGPAGQFKIHPHNGRQRLTPFPDNTARVSLDCFFRLVRSCRCYRHGSLSECVVYLKQEYTSSYSLVLTITLTGFDELNLSLRHSRVYSREIKLQLLSLSSYSTRRIDSAS